MVDINKLDAMNKLMFDPTIGRAKVLIYGPPGAGKTTLAASIGDRLLDVVADPAGYESLYNHKELGLGTRIDTIRYAGVSQLETLADIFVEGGTSYDKYDTVLIDTMSNVASLDRDTVTKVKMKKKGDDFSWEDQQWPIYNENTLRVSAAILKLMLAPINVVMTAHSQEKEINGRQVTRPKFSPEVFAAISGQCSMIAYMTSSAGDVDTDTPVDYRRKLQFHPTRNIVAKSRVGGLPVYENLPKNSGNTLEGSRLREILLNWSLKGGELLSHEEAEEVFPESESVLPPVATEGNPSDPVESFGV